MSSYTTPNFSALGSLNIPAFFPVPPLMNIFAEWAALIPLVCHLASYRHAHQFVGQVTLLGRVSVGLFPKLGVLTGISRLIERSPEFLDTASMLGSSSRKVWDVKWGSTFPCANGAASDILAESLLSCGKAAVRIPEEIPSALLPQLAKDTTQCSKESASGAQAKQEPFSIPSNLTTVSSQGPIVRPNIRRYQTLHVLSFSKTKPSSSWHSILDRFFSSPIFEAMAFTCKIGIVVIFCLFGIYGTAATLLSGAVTQLVVRNIQIQRPSGFLGNNEVHDACMLVATHANASTWYLFVGDRGIVDSLLNKPMICIPSQKVAAMWLRNANIIQLLAMTFVAAQKGWDGVSLFVLLVISTIIKLRFSNKFLAKIFCEANGVVATQESFEFSGRTSMLGAIQKLSETRSWAWMDEILTPCARRDVWAKDLSSTDPDLKQFNIEIRNLNDFDRGWVLVNKTLAERAANMMRNAIGGHAEKRVSSCS
ncbi:hypothetical protein BP5796_12716 [Coleophoma crateriformis]|uniref:Uncharacterized protein n=1 Tax=Coleophoma crateriformis TaxID=565419 RepID=A0A3D8Q619_9HELO|nr:hypothetical protein BP5796_12716 [Coleophoma crateriformis]